jgi:hypothetical protein
MTDTLKLLAVFAHPDDEALGMSGTPAEMHEDAALGELSSARSVWSMADEKQKQIYLRGCDNLFRQRIHPLNFRLRTQFGKDLPRLVP